MRKDKSAIGLRIGVFLMIIIYIWWIMFDENSSNSDENVDFKGLLKKVDYEGEILDSDEE